MTKPPVAHRAGPLLGQLVSFHPAPCSAFTGASFNPPVLHRGRIDLIVPKSPRIAPGLPLSWLSGHRNARTQHGIFSFLFVRRKQPSSILTAGEVRQSPLPRPLPRGNHIPSGSPRVDLGLLNQTSNLLQLLCRLCLIPSYLICWQNIHLEVIKYLNH